MSAPAVRQSFEAFIQRAMAVRDCDYFETEYDPRWRSECELDEAPQSGISRWRPVPQRQPVDFRGLASALEQPIHPDICAWYGSFWSGGFEAKSLEGHVSLIQLWNREDFDRLVENLIGHALAKRRVKQPFTAFFATTEPESELFLSIDNESGKVLLEEPGKPPLKEVDESLARFLDRLTPLNLNPGIY